MYIIMHISEASSTMRVLGGALVDWYLSLFVMCKA